MGQLLRKRNDPLERVNHWNRRAWQEIVVLKKRVEIIEEKTSVETGGDFVHAVEGDPWEREVIIDHKTAVMTFWLGMAAGMLTGILLTTIGILLLR